RVNAARVVCETGGAAGTRGSVTGGQGAGTQGETVAEAGVGVSVGWVAGIAEGHRDRAAHVDGTVVGQGGGRGPGVDGDGGCVVGGIAGAVGDAAVDDQGGRTVIEVRFGDRRCRAAAACALEGAVVAEVVAVGVATGAARGVAERHRR